MSKGLGKLQQEILEVLQEDAAKPLVRILGLPDREPDVYEMKHIIWCIQRRRGTVGYPGDRFRKAGAQRHDLALQASFSRAIQGLVKRGLLQKEGRRIRVAKC